MDPLANSSSPDAPLLDARGLCCPLPLIRLQAALEPLASGERLRLWADDPSIEADLPAWSETTGHRLLSLTRGKDATWQALIEKN